MTQRWKVNSSKIVYSHPFFRVQEVDVTLPNGIHISDYTVWENKDVSQVVPILPNGQIVMVSQYKQGLSDFITECPGGFTNENEDPLESAKRELFEETGFESNDWISIGRFSHHPTKETGKLHLFVARDCFKSKLNATSDVSEIIDIRVMTFNEIIEEISLGITQQSGSMVALLLAKYHGYIKN